jgi:tripartite-type tricarboxylate transporter receptor subunit TctC
MKRLTAAVLVLLFYGPVHGQGYSSRPVRVIVPVSAGGLQDTMARAIAWRSRSPTATRC